MRNVALVGDEGLVALFADGLAQDLFRSAARINIRGIEEVDSRFETYVD